jgi:hypothetical protein
MTIIIRVTTTPTILATTKPVTTPAMRGGDITITITMQAVP